MTIPAARVIIGFAVLSMGFVRQTTDAGTPLEWKDRCPLLELGQLDPHGPSLDELRTAFGQALSGWESGSCASLPFALSEPARGTSEVTLDGRNVIVTRGADYCDDLAHADEEICLSPTALAVTTLYFVDRPGDIDDGSIVEADMEINLVHPFATDGRPEAFDLTAVLTHEIGHILGLGHTCTTSPSARLVDPSGREVPSCTFGETDPNQSATMYPWAGPGELSGREPSGDEQQAMCLLYRNRPTTCAGSDLTTGCSADPAATPRLVILVGIVIVLVSRRRRRSW